MYWIGYRKALNYLLVFFFLACTACSNEVAPGLDNDSGEAEQEKRDLSSEEAWIIQKIERELKISATEKYDIDIIYHHINPDTLMDALILVNRKEYAFQHVKRNNTESFFKKTGETGPFNYVFVKLGGRNDIIPTTPVGSNVNYPIKAAFLELTSKSSTDFYVEYRINNSLQRNYYTVKNNQIHLTFSCPVFDNIGEETPIAYEIKHIDSPVRMAKDIALYHAELKNYNAQKIVDVNAYEPTEIIGSDDLYVYFIFDEKTMKYKTPMQAPEVEEH